MTAWTDHLVIAPIVVPMLAGAAMILAGNSRRGLAAGIGLVSTTLLLVLSAVLLALADAPEVRIYRLGDWPASFGIVLVLDRLAAMMVTLASVLGFAAFVFSLARWHRAGAHFHPLFQFQLMGLNGAFLTGDLFNLFVFFEVMLAASYGMALHGSGTARVRAGLHYIIINLLASLLFLVGVSVVYGIAGTLNLADLAIRIQGVATEDRALLEAGLAVLGVAFLVKAAMWPLGFWLPGTYAAASAPAAAILSILSKVGIYAVLRVWLLLFGSGAGASAGFGATALSVGGLLTIAFGSVAVLASQNMVRLAGGSVLVSSGTLLVAIGMGQAAVTGGALFYLAGSVLAIGALFLLVELVERGRDIGADVLAVTREAFGSSEHEEDGEPGERDAIGVPIPATAATLGVSFLACALLIAGLPPLSGFLAKFAMLSPLLTPGRGAPPAMAWVMAAALILSGLATVVATVRAGMDAFWAAPASTPQRVSVVEFLPVALLLALCTALTVAAGPALDYATAAAEALYVPADYLRAVLPVLEGQPMRRIVPHPLFALFLLIAWLLLMESASPGAVLLGGVLAIGSSWALVSLAPPHARLRRLAVLPGLLRDVVVEVVRSNNAVAWIILGPAARGERRSGFVHIPLDMRDPYGLAALACILTATPGTVWVEYDSVEGIMLLHVLDLIDEAEWVRIVKEKWERRLMEIFE